MGGRKKEQQRSIGKQQNARLESLAMKAEGKHLKPSGDDWLYAK